MLALTKKTDYALIALTHLAGRTGVIVSARELAALTRVPLPILMNILKTLAHAGVVVSVRGAGGGYSLAKAAEAINLYELITAVEGPFNFVQCVGRAEAAEPARGSCELVPCCPIRVPAHRIQGRLREFLEGVTLAELIQEAIGPIAGPAIELRDTSLLRQPALREFAK